MNSPVVGAAWPGQAVLVAATYGPRAEPGLHELGTSFAEEAPHEAGSSLLRAATAVRKEAYDQVRSAAERGLPSSLEYCSARAPSAGVNLCTTAMKPSA